MTLKEYLKTGSSDLPSMAAALGVTPHAVRKWVYGQREPSLSMALEIVKLSRGKIALGSLVKPQ